MARLLGTVGLLVAFAGCNCGGGHPDGGTGGGNGADVIIGHRLLFYRLETSELSRPDFQLANITVRVPANGGFTDRSLLGTDDDGGFSAVNVPVGDYYFELPGPFDIVTSERNVDLDDHNNLGRPDLNPALNDNPVSFTLTGLTSTLAPDFVMVTPNTGFYGEALPLMQPSMPVTSLIDAGGRFTTTLGALPDGTMGDNTWLLQRLTRDAGDSDGGLVAYHSAERFAQLSAVSLNQDGGLVTAVLTAPSPTPLDATLSTADYLSHLTEINPMATVQGFELNVFPSPAAPNLPPLWAGFSGSVLDYFSSNLPSSPLHLQYADAYPSAWQRMLSFDVVFNVPAALPNTTGTSSAFIGDTIPLASFTGTLKPRLSPVLAVKVDGADGFTGANLQSLTPTLSWTPPAVGTASGYLVGVYKLIGAGNTTRRFQAGTIATTNTHAQVPPGMISPQGLYLFRVTAQMTPGIDLGKHPLAFPTAVDLAVADVYTGIWNSE